MGAATSSPMPGAAPPSRLKNAGAVARGRREGEAPDAGCDGNGFPWLPAAGLGYLTVSSGLALRRSWHDPAAAAFVGAAYADLVLLFLCLRRYERTDAASPLRGWLKLAVWLLTSALTLLFSVKVAAVMPAAVAAAVWLMALATIAGGFVAFFCVDGKAT